MQTVDPRIPLKSSWFAGFLAFLVPGAGHFYQGRLFKGAIYSTCILGTFFCGMALGDWQPVYHRMDKAHTHYGYLSQFMVGLPAVPALVQSRRYRDQLQQQPTFSPTEGEFTGSFTPLGSDQSLPAHGHILLQSEEGALGTEFSGTFAGAGAVPAGETVRVSARGPLRRWNDPSQLVELEPGIYPSRNRRITCEVLAGEEDDRVIGTLSGTIPRELSEWYQVPLDDLTLQRLHGTLGKRFDLAVVYTWIAGLLNVLAIWDALEGPAYGYGDEEESGS